MNPKNLVAVLLLERGDGAIPVCRTRSERIIRLLTQQSFEDSRAVESTMLRNGKNDLATLVNLDRKHLSETLSALGFPVGVDV